MKAPTLFPASELIQEGTRIRWRENIAFLWEHGRYITEWESGFLTSIKRLVDAGEDLTLNQSAKLSKIFKREQGRIG